MNKIPTFINAAILLSAWSAASSDVYISSRFLFFLARSRHAPSIFAYLSRYPSGASTEEEEEIDDQVKGSVGHNGDDRRSVANRSSEGPPTAMSPAGRHSIGSEISPNSSSFGMSVPTLPATQRYQRINDVEGGPLVESKPWYVIPLFAVLGSSVFGFLAFLNLSTSGAQAVR